MSLWKCKHRRKKIPCISVTGTGYCPLRCGSHTHTHTNSLYLSPPSLSLCLFTFPLSLSCCSCSLSPRPAHRTHTHMNTLHASQCLYAYWFQPKWIYESCKINKGKALIVIHIFHHIYHKHIHAICVSIWGGERRDGDGRGEGGGGQLCCCHHLHRYSYE